MDVILSVVSVDVLYTTLAKFFEVQDAVFTHPRTVDFINTLLVVFVVVNLLQENTKAEEGVVIVYKVESKLFSQR